MTVYRTVAGVGISSSLCEYGKHTTNPNHMYVYADAINGIAEGNCCYECYAAHILKYYPDGPMAAHIRTHPDEYKNEESLRRS